MKRNRLWMATGLAALAAILVAGCATTGGRTIREETRIDQGTVSGTPTVSRTVSVDGEVIGRLESEWETETIEGTGYMTVVNRYDDPARNKALARTGAIAQARLALAEQIGEIQVTETVVVRDMVTSQRLETRLQQIIQGSHVVSEHFDEESQTYEVVVSMPKANVLTVVREAVSHRNR